MKSRTVNLQSLLEGLVFLCFSGNVFYLMVTQKYLYYVTPRMAPYLWFSAMITALWAGMRFAKLFKPQYRVRSAHCFVLVIPLLILMLPHSMLSSADVSTNFVSVNPNIQSNILSPKNSSSSVASTTANQVEASSIKVITSNTNIESDTSAINTSAADPSSSEISTEGIETSSDALSTGLDRENKRIFVSNDAFYFWISEIYTNLDDYEGYTITMTGYVFNDPQYFEENEFVPARLLMSCCSADLVPSGLVCEFDKASTLTSDSWVTVEGIITKGAYEGEVEPQIEVTKVTPAEEVAGYVYPF